ncbi:MAG: hypothetical protein AB8H79_00890 [Myxococcota bacterium]
MPAPLKTRLLADVTHHPSRVTLALGRAVAAVLGISLLGGCLTAEPKTDPVVTPSPAPPLVGQDKPESPAPEVAVAPTDSVAPTGDTGCTQDYRADLLDRDLRSVMGDEKRLQSLARLRPESSDNGGYDGIRFSAVNREELLYKIGVRSGDVVTDVGGQPLTSMGAAFGVLDGVLSGATREVEVRIMRRGQPVCLTVRVLDEERSRDPSQQR